MPRVLRWSWSPAVALGLFAILSIACTSTPTRLTEVWKDPTYRAGPMHNVVVFGGRMNETDRRTLEDTFTAALAAHGVRATPSYQFFPGALPSRDEARNTMQRAGVEAALVSSLRSIHERTTFVEGAAPAFWSDYYGPGWGGAYGPGYLVTEPIVKFETSLWDLRGQSRLVWSAVTDTDNPSSGRDFASSLTKEVVPALSKAGLLPPPTGKEVAYAPEHAPPAD